MTDPAILGGELCVWLDRGPVIKHVVEPHRRSSAVTLNDRVASIAQHNGRS